MPEELDLNLLRVFDALIDTSSVNEAALRLHLSQSATSHALGRLRRAMNDPILVRAGRRLVPTTFALDAAPRVRNLLATAATLRVSPELDDPRSWERTFAIRLNDGLIPVLAPRVTRLVTASAPGVRIRFVRQDSKDPDQLRDGSLDLDVGVVGPPPPDVFTERLFTDRFVAAVAADSALGQAAELSVDDLCRYPHISSSRRGLARGPLDDALKRDGRSRRVTAVVPSYAVGALIALEQDVICLVPLTVARHLVDRAVPLRWHEVPYHLPEADVELRWHRRADTDPASRWLRARIREAVQPLLETSP
ncbi:LysR substrate-binding domain-containing protein [Kribbella sp. NPDC056861]|uniref:LysR substrate-binding domain-containing protein n=1 Tax=Kribbella sp. NPDC056861 TaxID=3154857 RepID=UPI00342E7584